MREVEASQPSSHARHLLLSVRGKRLAEPELMQASVELAGLLLAAAEAHKRPKERERAAILARLMGDVDGQVFTTLLADRVFRSQDPQRVVDAARHLLRRLGVPRYLPAGARLALQGLLRVGPFAPKTAAAGMLNRLRQESEHVVLPARDPALADYLARRAAEGVRINLNHLGEAVLGEEEAARRVQDYVELLSRPDVEAISVKVSSIFSQIELRAWDYSVRRVVERLTPIYRAALARPYARGQGAVPKLVTLDMEGYRDLHFTVAVFKAALDSAEFDALAGGIVLQAYLPDSAALQRDLTAWAQARAERGAAPIRLRIVKGANLLAERAESSARGWPLPIFASKGEVDASFKKMLDFGCEPAHARVVHLGIASHNLFDIAFGLVLRASRGVEAEVGFELLEGMADHVLRAVHAAASDVLAYAPLCDAESMHTAIAYLLRRLDENTSEHNFLRHSFGLRAGDAAWQEQRAAFERALGMRAAVRETPYRVGAAEVHTPAVDAQRFENEPDSDFALAPQRAWIAEILARWEAEPTFVLAEDPPAEIAASVAGELVDGFDPSRPGHVPYRFRLADATAVERALQVAELATVHWSQTPLAERAACLRAIARALREQRGELIAAMLLDAGKRVEQADAEVSEAIDFAEYYARTTLSFAAAHPELELRAAGPVLVTPPWNFPLAIPAGGVLAALMAGSAVILKPALETVLVGERLARLCWDAGVPRPALQFVVTSDERASALVRDPRIARVILTGATSTARLFQRLRPGLALSAETGGKNSMFVSALADRDEAIKDALAAAFGHAGQKCSACSLLICEAEVYDDPGFLTTLRDAAQSLPVGSSWDARSVVTPLIAPPRAALLDGLTRLDDGESWLLQPRCDPDNPRLWSPGIKLGVREGSAAHTTELFGPVLAVMRAEDLDHALRIANTTPYGLTAGLHSLDEREQQRWAERIAAGNLYINRTITGAIVGRQPFGGWKASSFGPGAKAGGPNYVLQLAEPWQRDAPAIRCAPAPAAAELAVRVRPHLGEAARERLGVGLCSYAHAQRTHFGLDHDPCAIPGERNVFRYRPCASLLVRAGADAEPSDVLLAIGAALTSGVAYELSVAPRLYELHPQLWGELPAALVHAEDAATFCRRVAPPHERVRALGTVEPQARDAAEAAHVHWEASPVLLSGRLELLRYHREQSVSQRYHRYGNLAGGRLLPALREAPEPELRVPAPV